MEKCSKCGSTINIRIRDWIKMIFALYIFSLVFVAFPAKILFDKNYRFAFSYYAIYTIAWFFVTGVIGIYNLILTRLKKNNAPICEVNIIADKDIKKLIRDYEAVQAERTANNHLQPTPERG